MFNPRVAVFCKTFRDDFDRLQALLASYEAHAPSVPFLLSVPEEDRALLRDTVTLSRNVTVICDEEYASGPKIPFGWMEQQVCKLSVHKTGFAETYLSVDADAYFINAPTAWNLYRDRKLAIVYSKVFAKWEDWNGALHEYVLRDGSAPEIPMSEGRLDGFDERLHALRDRIGDAPLLPDQRGRFIGELFDGPGVATQPGQILHARVLARMESFLAAQGLSLRDAINLAPWEYDWYARYAAADPNIEAVGIVSPILHFASDAAIAHAKGMGVTREMLKRRFTAVQMAARHFDTREF